MAIMTLVSTERESMMRPIMLLRFASQDTRSRRSPEARKESRYETAKRT